MCHIECSMYSILIKCLCFYYVVVVVQYHRLNLMKIIIYNLYVYRFRKSKTAAREEIKNKNKLSYI